VLVDAALPTVAEEEVVRLTVSPITTPIMARAEIHPILLFRRIENHRRSFEPGGGSADAMEADPSGGETGREGGAALELDSVPAGGFSGEGVGS
jgi:hypothetical protein